MPSRAGRKIVLATSVFIVGAVGGTLLDQIHVRAHVLHYAHPTLAGQAWWVAPQFGAAVVLLFFSIAAAVGRRARDRIPLIVDAIAFVAAYTVTGLLHRESWLVALVLVVIWIGLVAIHRDRPVLVLVSIGLAIVGPTYESIVTSTGAFRYDVTPLVLRVPVWLPALYLIAGVLASSVVRALFSRAN